MAKLRLVLAVGHYDRLVPLLDGTVSADGIDLTVLPVSQSAPARDGSRRHERMLKGEFDAAEIGISLYLMVKTRGAPFTAIPIFPRRLFSQSLVYCNWASGIQTPADLIWAESGCDKPIRIRFASCLKEICSMCTGFHGRESIGWHRVRS